MKRSLVAGFLLVFLAQNALAYKPFDRKRYLDTLIELRSGDWDSQPSTVRASLEKVSDNFADMDFSANEAEKKIICEELWLIFRSSKKSEEKLLAAKALVQLGDPDKKGRVFGIVQNLLKSELPEKSSMARMAGYYEIPLFILVNVDTLVATKVEVLTDFLKRFSVGKQTDLQVEVLSALIRVQKQDPQFFIYIARQMEHYDFIVDRVNELKKHYEDKRSRAVGRSATTRHENVLEKINPIHEAIEGWALIEESSNAKARAKNTATQVDLSVMTEDSASLLLSVESASDATLLEGLQALHLQAHRGLNDETLKVLVELRRQLRKAEEVDPQLVNGVNGLLIRGFPSYLQREIERQVGLLNCADKLLGKSEAETETEF